MKTRSLLLGAAASLALAASANAHEINGWYVSLEGGGNWIDDLDVTRTFDANPPGPPLVVNMATFSVDTGWAVLAGVGYGFGGNWRAEFEAGYRNNHTTLVTEAEIEEWSAMVNVLYDIHLTPSMTLSLGAGAGGDFANLDIGVIGFDEDEWNFAYQGIAGLSYALTDHLDLTLTYRYFRVLEPEFEGLVILPGPGTLDAQFDDVVKHTATIGLRYAFGASAAEPVYVAPPPPPPPEPAAMTPHEFIVFFGHNKSNLTGEALDVIRQAAAAAKEYGSATIRVVGHADRSGSPKYNQNLSLRRANVVSGALVNEGVAKGAISVSGKGESEPMVPTADGVREPQNRRVHISL